MAHLLSTNHRGGAFPMLDLHALITCLQCRPNEGVPLKDLEVHMDTHYFRQMAREAIREAEDAGIKPSLFHQRRPGVTI